MAIELTFYGISCFSIRSESCSMLVDPCISKNPVCPIRVDEVPSAEVILVTHGAYDHMGDAVDLQKATGATLICGPDVKVHAIDNGVRPENIVAMLWGDAIDVKGVHIQAVECRHVSFFKSGDHYLSGLPLSFVISFQDGTVIYNIGDSALFGDMRLIGELYRPNLALVPIGGNLELSGGYTHLGRREAALCTQWVGARTVIPTHCNPGSHEIDDFALRVEKLDPSIQVKALNPGETLVFSP